MIIAILGLIGSGKSTIAEYLVKQHQFNSVSFASPLKDCLAAIFNWDRNKLEGLTVEDRIWRESVDVWWSKRLNIENFSPRHAMQHFGTDVCRNHFHTDIWVASLENSLNDVNGNIVITDCRFQNEAVAVKNMQGSFVRVIRNNVTNTYGANLHQSELDLLDFKVDYEFDNDQDLNLLYLKVDEYIKKIS